MLRRHDYVPRWWAAGPTPRTCADHVESGGLMFPTRRWVRPVGPRNRELGFPTMVSLRLSEIEVA